MVQRHLGISVCLILLVCAFRSNGQVEQPHNALAASYQAGYVFGTNGFLRGENRKKEDINFYQNASFKFGRQTDGSELWHRRYNFPFYGAGFHVADYNSPDEIGTPFTVFGFCSFPLHRWQNLSLIYDLEVGVSFNWEPYSIEHNPYNVVMGSKGQGYVGMGFFADFKLSKRWIMNAGVHFAHYSNGAVKRPNLGINSISPKVILRYNLYEDVINYDHRDVPEFDSNNEWTVSLYAGEKQIITETTLDSILRFKREKHQVYGLTTSYHRKISYKSKFGIGTSFSYDGSNNSPDSAWTDNLQWSIFPSYELDVGKFTIIIQPGFYLVRTQTLFNSERWYQRVGFKYHILENLFVGVNVRAFYFSAADYLEWNLGYRLNWH